MIMSNIMLVNLVGKMTLVNLVSELTLIEALIIVGGIWITIGLTVAISWVVDALRKGQRDE